METRDDKRDNMQSIKYVILQTDAAAAVGQLFGFF